MGPIGVARRLASNNAEAIECPQRAIRTTWLAHFEHVVVITYRIQVELSAQIVMMVDRNSLERESAQILATLLGNSIVRGIAGPIEIASVHDLTLR